MGIFEERQRFTQWWLWFLMTIPLAFMLFKPLKRIIGGETFSIVDLDNGFWIGLTTMSLVYIFMAICHLTTVIDKNGITYQLFPFQTSSKRISWNDLERAYVRQYKPLSEYGGWGYRLGLGGGRALNVKGNQGIQLKLKNGKKLLLGTQKPQEARLVIQKYFENERV